MPSMTAALIAISIADYVVSLPLLVACGVIVGAEFRRSRRSPPVGAVLDQGTLSLKGESTRRLQVLVDDIEYIARRGDRRLPRYVLVLRDGTTIVFSPLFWPVGKKDEFVYSLEALFRDCRKNDPGFFRDSA